jgi:hypothetical protein
MKGRRMSNAAEAAETPTQAVSSQLARSSGLEKILATGLRALSSHAHIAERAEVAAANPRRND